MFPLVFFAVITLILRIFAQSIGRRHANNVKHAEYRGCKIKKDYEPKRCTSGERENDKYKLDYRRKYEIFGRKALYHM